MRIPRYFVDCKGLIVIFGSVRFCLAFLLFLYAKLISASLECSRGELYVLDQS